MGQKVGGRVTYGSTEPSSSGGGIVAGARNGLSLDSSDFAVLGQDVGEAGDPAKLTNFRFIPMENNAIVFEFVNTTFDALYFNLDAPIDFFSTAAGLWQIWTPSNYNTNYTPGGRANRFYSGYDIYPGVNLPTSTRPNVVGMFWGYNMGFNQGRVDATEAAFRYATETCFYIGSDPYAELHTPEFITEGGTVLRLDSSYVDKTTGIQFRELVCDNLSMYSTAFNPSGGLFYWLTHYISATDEAQMALFSQFAGGVSVFNLGNQTDGSGFISFQSGQMNMSAPTIASLSSPRVALVSTNYINAVNPMVCSNNETDTPTGDAMVEISSTTLGFRLPSMTTTERLAVAAAAGRGGLLVWDSDIGAVFAWDGAAWNQLL